MSYLPNRTVWFLKLAGAIALSGQAQHQSCVIENERGIAAPEVVCEQVNFTGRISAKDPRAVGKNVAGIFIATGVGGEVYLALVDVKEMTAERTEFWRSFHRS